MSEEDKTMSPRIEPTKTSKTRAWVKARFNIVDAARRTMIVVLTALSWVGLDSAGTLGANLNHNVIQEADTERTILLVDDHGVLYRPGTKRVLHPLTRHEENPVIARDKPWEARTIAYCSVH